MGDDLDVSMLLLRYAGMDGLRRLDCRCLAGSLCGGRNRQGLSGPPGAAVFLASDAVA